MARKHILPLVAAVIISKRMKIVTHTSPHELLLLLVLTPPAPLSMHMYTILLLDLLYYWSWTTMRTACISVGGSLLVFLVFVWRAPVWLFWTMMHCC
jgi:hypothetical protein